MAKDIGERYSHEKCADEAMDQGENRMTAAAKKGVHTEYEGDENTIYAVGALS